ncbi:transposase [Streptomyces kebangsaanensis]|uniref:Transposase n=1 Tax=Streptomyces kebangsaanensis TaxID=864058 RepID=A0ABW6L2A0_9ACTN
MTLEQAAAGFGVHAVTLSKWMRRADIDDGVKPGTTSQENAEPRQARRRIKLLEQENGVLRRAAAHLPQATAGKRIYPFVKEPAADGLPVAVTCRVLQLAGQPCCRRPGRPVTDAVLEEAYRANALFDVPREDPEFGCRFLADEARDAGSVMGDRPVNSAIQPAGRPTTHLSDQGCCNDWLNLGSSGHGNSSGHPTATRRPGL